MRNDWHVEDGWRICLGECIDRMADIPDGSVDMVMADLPYGTTKNRWDSVIPLDLLWPAYKRICKKNAAIVLTASQPFTSVLVGSNLKNYHHCWSWEKTKITGVLNAKKQPVRNHEDVLVFCDVSPTYNPQGLVFKGTETKQGGCSSNYGDRAISPYVQQFTNYPRTALKIASAGKTTHPTQKPVALMEYLIKTYTNEGETVMDNTMGSGTTGVACANTKRRFIGIEQDPNYYEVAKNRIAEAFVPKPKPETLFSEGEHGTIQA